MDESAAGLECAAFLAPPHTEQAMATDILSTQGLSREAVEALSAARDEPTWLRDWRLAAWETYEATPLPTRQDEDWRRTDIRALKLDQFAPCAPSGDAGATAGTIGNESAGALELRDSALVSRAADAALADQGVLFLPLDRAVREHGDLVQRHLGSVAPASTGKFPALNAALWSGGVFVYVPRNVDVALPLEATLVQATAGAALLPRTLIVLERGARLTFIGQMASSGDEGPALHNGVTELVLADDASLRYVTIQSFGRQVWNLGFERARLARNARLEWAVGSLGGRLTKTYLQAELAGPGAEARMVGAVLGDGSQHFDHHTLTDHVAPHASSNTTFRTVLTDSARSVFVGLIRVDKQAQQTDAYLQNRNLLLSEKAKADSIPRLEIEANDVRCTHGATVSPVDPEQVFYIQARGLPHDDAERMIVEGFFEPLLEAIPAESVRERLRAALADKVRQGRG
jgi:Fe-S cluster assembly protein SufD